MTKSVDVETVRGWLAEGGEIAFLDVREEGQHGSGHPLLAVNLPYSRLESEISRLVPRRSCPIVLLDDMDGVAAKSARRLTGLGYDNLQILAGGAAAWSAAGHPLFSSTNVPSKGFAEIVEHKFATPAISAAELDGLRRSGARVTVLDSRPIEEYARFHVPGAISCPGAELVHRFGDLVDSPDALVVVSCAGRTRGIIGAQSLINAGVPNRVVSLSGGTQGWRLAGLELETGLVAQPGPVSGRALAEALDRAEAVGTRFGIGRIDHSTVGIWLDETDRRTTYLLDVRTPEEFARGHVPGSVSAPRGQLVQAIDRWVGTRGARLVLVDDTGIRAIMTAHWLKQMGWDVQILDRGLEEVVLETGSGVRASSTTSTAPVIEPAEAASWLAQGAAAVSLETSAEYREAHPDGAVWSIRPRLDRLPASVLESDRLVLFAEDDASGQLAAVDLAELTLAHLTLVRGGTRGWARAGLPVTASPGDPPDEQRIDYLFWNHDRHAGNRNAMRAYLQWETELPAQIAADGLAGFRLAAP
jgi:rhodanese-related sulfurtransferase